MRYYRVCSLTHVFEFLENEEEFELSNKLYVGGLSYNTTEGSLENLFSQAGTISSVHIIMDRETGRAKGFGFVEMTDAEGAARAISMFNGTEFEGRSIIVNEAKPQTDRPPRSNPGYGNRTGSGGGRY